MYWTLIVINGHGKQERTTITKYKARKLLSSGRAKQIREKVLVKFCNWKVLVENGHKTISAWTDKVTAMESVNSGYAVLVEKNIIKKIGNYTSLRKSVLIRDNYICHYCGEEGDTIDHIIPRANGGMNTEENLVCACSSCNKAKGKLSYDEFVNRELVGN